jgi:hypothetical protein
MRASGWVEVRFFEEYAHNQRIDQEVLMRTFIQILCLLTVTLAGCANFAPDNSLIGRDRSTVIAAMGPPSLERQLPTGSRMEYPRGPFGKSTFFVFLDKDNKVTRWENVLITQNFEKIFPGMLAADVEFLIGQSKSNFSLSNNHIVWEYPFSNSTCQVFQVQVSSNGKVDSTGYGFSPECDSSW